MDEKWLDNITKDDMPNEFFQQIAEENLPVAIYLLKNCCGNTIYVPTEGFKILKIKHILKTYDGSTVSLKKLASELQVSEQYIRNVLKKYRNIDIADGQLQFNIFKEGN